MPLLQSGELELQIARKERYGSKMVGNVRDKLLELMETYYPDCRHNVSLDDGSSSADFGVNTNIDGHDFYSQIGLNFNQEKPHIIAYGATIPRGFRRQPNSLGWTHNELKYSQNYKRLTPENSKLWEQKVNVLIPRFRSQVARLIDHSMIAELQDFLDKQAG